MSRISIIDDIFILSRISIMRPDHGVNAGLSIDSLDKRKTDVIYKTKIYIIITSINKKIQGKRHTLYQERFFVGVCTRKIKMFMRFRIRNGVYNFARTSMRTNPLKKKAIIKYMQPKLASLRQ